ncbi:D-aminoacylase [Adhaeribacter rhizoryzae]|uniref:D-aminoacylase n=2 Tax=Adhaeribacter rhizoryzae TaxID=2607907 RepID=A0A5M6D4Y6_9BACT|nr:D-aminoacylase [Adhaeribacter rhizoryzae]
MFILYLFFTALLALFTVQDVQDAPEPKIQVAESDLLLKNGKIIDGTGNSWYYGDVAVQGDRIIAIGTSLNIPAKKIIDVNKKVIAPGFIDVHTHIEGDEKAAPQAENFVYDGVTSIITGNCGISNTDIGKYYRYLDSLKLSINIGSFIGHNDVRKAVMKMDNRQPTPTELNQMELLVEKAMQDGAMGFSTGLIYTPGTYAGTPEVVALAKAAAKYQGVYTSHIRNETNKIFEAIDEALNIGRKTGMPVQVSHFKIGKPNWNRSNETLAMIKKAREEGLEVTIDQYPYTASSTTIYTLIPSWALAGGQNNISSNFRKPAIRKKIIAEMVGDMKRRQRPDFSYAVVASYKANPAYNGKNISQINQLLKRPKTIPAEIETILDLAEKESAQMVFHSMNEADVEYILQYPFTMVTSDGGLREFGVGVPHPRSYGTNARVLSHYVRDRKIIMLEDAIRRMTSLPAQKFGLTERGLLRKGLIADIVVFDPNTIKDLSTFEKPHAYTKGVEYVLVNGQLTLAEGKHTGARNGGLLYGPGYQE